MGGFFLAKAEVRIEIKLDTKLYKIVVWILEHSKPLWYLWRWQILKWLTTGKPIPLVRYKTEFDKKWKWLKSSINFTGSQENGII